VFRDAFNTNVTGFDVFKVTLNNVTLNPNAGPITPLMDFFQQIPTAVLPVGTTVVGFFAETSGPHPGDLIGTAASGDLVVTTPFAAIKGGQPRQALYDAYNWRAC
jgi:hypothetical protein